MKHNPDDRRDNVDKIQFNINHTIENMEMTEDPRQKKAIKEKNVRRKDALDGFRNEIKDEAEAKEHRYK